MMKQYDFLIFGATGFTGRFVVERLVQTIQKYEHLKKLRWAVAARNVDMLKIYLKDIETICRTNLKHVPIFRTDINDPRSLNDVFQKSTLVLNCVGPYSLLGDPVLKSCIESDAHYMDLSGEPLFLEKVQLKYDDLARQKKICAIGSCGFDSIPSDLGISYLKQEFPGRLNHAEHYLQIWADGRKFNYATWRALVEGYKYRHQLKAMRKELFAKYKPYRWNVKLERKTFHKNEFGICVPFPGSDRSVVIRSQMYRYTHFGELPVQCEVYFGLARQIEFWKLAAMNVNLKTLTRFNWGEKLLLDHARRFSFGIFDQNVLPDRKDLERNRFSMSIVGRGWPRSSTTFDQKTMTQQSMVKISGGDLGYIDTAIMAVQTALAFLDKIDRQPKTLQYGVVTPAIAFEPNEIIPRLQKEGIQIEFISEYKNS